MNENIFRKIFENSSMGFVYFKTILNEREEIVDYVILDMNESFENIIGEKKETVLNGSLLTVIPEFRKTLNEMVARYKDKSRDKLTIEVEEYLVHLNKYLKIQITKLGKRLYSAVFTDITKRLTAESEMIKEKDLLQAVFDNVPLGFMVLDGNGNFLNVNKEYEKISGYKKGDIKSTNEWFLKVYPDKDYRNYVINKWSEDKSSEDATREFHIITKNGEKKEIEYRAAFLKDGRSVVSMADITERMKGQTEITGLKNKLQLALEIGNTGVWEFDYETKRMYWDKSMFKLYKVDPEEFTGEVEFFKKILIREDFEKDAQIINEAIENKGIYNNEFRVKLPSGKIKYLKARGKIITDKSGKVIKIVGINHDITDIKTAELAAIAANKSKSDFLANISHEIRTPMNGVIGFSELLKDTPLNEEQCEFIKNVILSGKKLMMIINDILDFSKIEANKLELEMSKTGIHELLKNSINIIRPKADSKNISLKLEIDDRLPHEIISDPLRLSQIINNLLSNAVKFTDDGEITLSARVLKRGDHAIEVEYAVKDTGIGIKQEKITQIFNAFTQADSSVTRKYGGTGLGLTISNNLAKLLGSCLKVNSFENNGSRFSFRVCSELSETESQIEVKNTKTETNLKILLIEDDYINQKLIKKIIKKEYPEVSLAITDDGNRAYDLYVFTKPDMIFTDIQISGINGFILTEKIRLFDSEIPIIALTGDIRQGNIDKMKEVGINEYLSKPFDAESLLGLIGKYINQREG